MFKSRLFVQVATLLLLLLAVLANYSVVTAFSAATTTTAAFVQEQPTVSSRTVFKKTSDNNDVVVKLPDMEDFFIQVQKVSPLAKLVISNNANLAGARGFAAAIQDTDSLQQKWKTIEKHSTKNKHNPVVAQIEKIDNFQNHPAPLLRFRTTINGPCLCEPFAAFIMDLNERKKWDSHIESVYEAYSISDLEAANKAIESTSTSSFDYGDCQRLGIGYCQTKANFGIAPREQLTLCGVQEFSSSINNNGDTLPSYIIWGVEMDESHDHLLPTSTTGQRPQRAKSHIFATTLTPTSKDAFDVEYVIQLEAGGKLPTWLTTPVMLESIKAMFSRAQKYYSGKTGELDEYLRKQQAVLEKEDVFTDGRHSILMTP